MTNYTEKTAKLMTELAENEKLTAKIETDKEEIRTTWANIALPLQQELETIDEKYRPMIETLSDRLNETQKRSNEIKNEITRIEAMKKLDADWTVWTPERLRAYALSLGAPLDEHNFLVSDRIQGASALENGVNVIRVSHGYNYSDGWNAKWNVYLAFFGKKCIGFSARRTAEHQGDYTYPLSVIDLKHDKIFRKNEEREFGLSHLQLIADKFDCSSSERVNFRDWMKSLALLERKKLEKAKGINLSDTHEWWSRGEATW